MLYHTQVAWPYQSSAVQMQLLPEGVGAGTLVPKMDIFETREEVVYIFEMPGINSDQLEVEIEGKNIVVSAPVLTINPQECSYRYQERPKGRLMRIVPAAYDIDLDRVKAELRNGLLEIRFMKKLKDTQPGRKIHVDPVQ